MEISSTQGITNFFFFFSVVDRFKRGRNIFAWMDETVHRYSVYVLISNDIVERSRLHYGQLMYESAHAGVHILSKPLIIVIVNVRSSVHTINTHIRIHAHRRKKIGSVTLCRRTILPIYLKYLSPLLLTSSLASARWTGVGNGHCYSWDCFVI